MGEVLLVFLVPVLALMFVRLLDGATARSPRRAQFLGWLRQTKVWHVLVALALSALLFAATLPGPGTNALPLYLAVLTVLALVVRAWRYEFLFLMALDDEELPGRYDKLIWAAALLVAPPFGIWFFRSYREARWPKDAAVKDDFAPSAV